MGVSRTSEASKARRREKYKIKRANAKIKTSKTMDMDVDDMAEAGELIESSGENGVDVEDVAQKTAHKRNRIGKGARERRKLKLKEKRRLKKNMLHENTNIGDEDTAVDMSG